MTAERIVSIRTRPEGRVNPTTHVLSYAPGPDLAAGDIGTVSGLRFKVARPPEQISATEMRVQLVRVPA